ncbi:MAG TPA: methylthioribulose 1-phosphate dehydratase [Bryobacteraceae bacterium]|nr:methylthioribulose 1-phosphate dehydratase [Bryobacteraceae bacterium]
MVICDLADVNCARAAFELAEAGRALSRRGWISATSGNFSARISSDPLRLLVTRKGADKATLSNSDFLVVDRTGALIAGSSCASAETAIHLAVIRATGASAVLHTSSAHTMMLAERRSRAGGLAVRRGETLETLSGLVACERYVWIPALENSHDYLALSRAVENRLMRRHGCHGLLLWSGGLYTWGADTAEACRHVEALEALADILTKSRD